MGRRPIAEENKVKYKNLAIAFPEEDYKLFTQHAKSLGILPSKLARTKIMEGVPARNVHNIDFTSDQDEVLVLKAGKRIYRIIRKDVSQLLQVLTKHIISEIQDK